MSKIRIKNFGPIKSGLSDANGNEWLDVKKVTVFIGNQGSGKSTVAKVISTLTWMEKALNRGDIDEPKTFFDFIEHFKYQGINDYFRGNTIIDYKGDAFNISLGHQESKPQILIQRNSKGRYLVPKISYVPAERSFLSVVKNATGVRGLPEPLFDFAEEFRMGQKEIGENEINLPINNVTYKYHESTDTSFIYGQKYRVNLLNASSGFQSLVPLFLVSSTLAKRISKNSELSSSSLNVIQSIRMNEQIVRIMQNEELTDTDKLKASKEIQSRYINKCFINIVEEPEQNLFPTSQHKLLNSLLGFNNMIKGNKLIVTTHSPYLINYLTLAVKANMVKAKIDSGNSKDKLDKIVPLHSTIQGDDLVIYELDEKEGTITKLDDYKGLPSDQNDLNTELEESNELFAQLQEIEKGWR